MKLARVMLWLGLGLVLAAIYSGGPVDAVEERLSVSSSVGQPRVRSVPPASVPSCPNDPVEVKEYRLTVQVPSNCQVQFNRSRCDLFVGINTNRQDPSFLDVVLEGKAEGWVAVGFSKTRDMFGSNVLGCTRYGNDSVHVIDTWNPYKGRANYLNENQSGICQYSANFSDGRLECRFSRLIESVNGEQDFNLDGEFYTLFGVGSTPAKSGSDGLTYHGRTPPSISERKMNPATSHGSLTQTNAMLILTKTHGILMVVAWPILAVTAVYFSAFMKPALPNGQWFQVHRALMLGALFLAVSSFIIIFARHWNTYPRPGLIDLTESTPLAHFVIGIMVMTLLVINPLIALFRCKPDGKFRWIFNILHGKTIGYLALLLAATNISLGIWLINGSEPTVAFGLDLSIIGYALLLFVTAHFIFNLLRIFYKKGTDDQEEHPLVTQHPAATGAASGKETGGKSDHIAKAKPSADSKLRWAGLVSLLLLLVPVTFTICVLIAVI